MKRGINIRTLGWLMATLLLLLAQACEDAYVNPDLVDEDGYFLARTWEVNSIQEFTGNGKIHLPAERHQFQFDKENTVLVSLDINTCVGTLDLSVKRQNVTFQEMQCSEACCESSFGLLLQEVLPQIEKFKYKDGELMLYGTSHVVKLQPTNFR